MPGELLRRRDGRVAVQPGQGHLVAVHGFQLGPHGGRQRSGQGSGGQRPVPPKQQPPGTPTATPRAPGHAPDRLPGAAAGSGAGGGRCAGGRGEGGRLEQLGGPDGGQQPGHAAVGHGSVGEPLRGAGRQFGRQRGGGRGQGSGSRRQRRSGGTDGEEQQRTGAAGAGREAGRFLARHQEGPGLACQQTHSPRHGRLFRRPRWTRPSSLAGSPQPHGVSQRGGPRLFGKRRFGRLFRAPGTEVPCQG